MVQGKFQDLAAMDDLLAEARWTDLWYLDALLLRAEWRSRVSNPGVRSRLSDQAIALVDRAVVVQPSLPMFAVRARAALSADRPDVLLESVASVAQWTVATAAGGNAALRARSRASLEELARLLDKQEPDPRVNAVRLAEVRAGIQDAIRSLTLH
jgi:hypothetical protein